MNLWRWFLAWLASLSADPAAIDREPVRCAAAVAAAYAAMLPADAPPTPVPPSPAPAACPCEGACKGTGFYKPDGRIDAKCRAGCQWCTPRSVLVPAPAAALPAECPDGKCQKNTFPDPHGKRK